MSDLAAYLRSRAAEDVGRLTPDERIRLALQLGDEDVRLYSASNGLSDDEARRRLARSRQEGRRRSASAAPP